MDTIISNRKTVAQVAVENPNSIKILSAYGIDYCCGGNKALEDVCAEKKIEVDKLMVEISQNKVKTPEGHRYENWTSDFLADYIENNHHTYVRTNIPEIKELLEKLYLRHGQNSPELYELSENFNRLSEELYSHMRKEELILFPAIRKTIREKIQIDVAAPVVVMEHEHEVAGGLLKAIRRITSDFTLPAEACTTWHIAYKKLQEFEQDLMLHIHLENNILFKK
ncbi:MAG: iron-sulfur cluster repair di-iron protein [Flammeovirgaceae bacterium]|nr:iron-sulfur cluster repair di-iron protein [Flammeovirgaceae bacterium]